MTVRSRTQATVLDEESRRVARRSRLSGANPTVLKVQERTRLDTHVFGGSAPGGDDRVEPREVQQADITKLGHDRHARQLALPYGPPPARESGRPRDRLEQARQPTAGA